jgi:hypothetical protein
MVSGHSIRGELNVPWPPETRSESIRTEGGLGLLSIYFHVHVDVPRETIYVQGTLNSQIANIQGYTDRYRQLILTEATETTLSCLFFCPSRCILFLDLFVWFRCLPMFDESPDATSGSTLDRGICIGQR